MVVVTRNAVCRDFGALAGTAAVARSAQQKVVDCSSAVQAIARARVQGSNCSRSRFTIPFRRLNTLIALADTSVDCLFFQASRQRETSPQHVRIRSRRTHEAIFDIAGGARRGTADKDGRTDQQRPLSSSPTFPTEWNETSQVYAGKGQDSQGIQQLSSSASKSPEDGRGEGEHQASDSHPVKGAFFVDGPF